MGRAAHRWCETRPTWNFFCHEPKETDQGAIAPVGWRRSVTLRGKVRLFDRGEQLIDALANGLGELSVQVKYLRLDQ